MPLPTSSSHSPNRQRRIALAGSLGAFALLATGCSRRESLVDLGGHGVRVISGWAMGSTYTVKLASGALSDAALAAAQVAVSAALREVEGLLSHYDGGSEVSRLNHQPLGEPLAVAESTWQVFDQSARVRAASGGAFDVTLGRAVDAWGFGPSERPRQALTAATVNGLRQAQHPAGLLLDARAGTITRQHDVLSNLSGIAKGYGVDRAALALESLGLGDYMVEVGGEIRTRGLNGQKAPWQLAIERPDAMPQQALRIVPLSGLSLATSGDYRNFFVEAGRRYSHEIDPGSAAPVAHALASVSVVAADCTTADAWSTALFVQGPQLGLRTANQQGLAAYFVVRQATGGFVETATPAFAALGVRAAA
jgi:thiamine biosynthesis lipoprotein